MTISLRSAAVAHGLSADGSAAGETTGVLIPFQDLTRRKQTYGGGRYLDARFTCPMPPPENRLKIAESAGEKAYAAGH